MKRLVIEENNWIELDNEDSITLNGNLVRVDTLTYDSIGGVVSNVPADKVTKGQPVSGRLTNLATFD